MSLKLSGLLGCEVAARTEGGGQQGEVAFGHAGRKDNLGLRCVCVQVRVGWCAWSELVDGAGAWGRGALTLIGIWRPWRSRGSGCEMSAAHHFHWIGFGFKVLGLDSRARRVKSPTQGVANLGVTDLGSKASRSDVKPN